MQNETGVYKFKGKDFSKPEKIYQPAEIRNRLMVDKTGRIWIGDKDKTVFITKTGEIKKISASNVEANKLLEGVNAFYTDRSGIMWIGTFGYGILKLNPEKENFHFILPQFTAYQLAEDNNGGIIANSLVRITMINEQLINFDSIKNQQHSEFIVKDKNGNYWRSADTASLIFNTKSNVNKQINLPVGDKDLKPFPLYLDSNNVLWMGYKRNFLQYNTATHAFHVYDYPLVQDKDIFDFLQCIYPDAGKILWLGTQNGLMRFNTKDSS